MANYSTLKAAVADVVKTNGTQAITGANLQAVLLSIINSVGGGGYIFKGVATPSTSPGTPDYNVAYIGGAGTYANFGTSVTVPVGSIGVFKYNGSWTKETITMFAGIDDVPTANSNNPVKSGGVYSEISRLDSELKENDEFYNEAFPQCRNTIFTLKGATIAAATKKWMTGENYNSLAYQIKNSESLVIIPQNGIEAYYTILKGVPNVVDGETPNYATGFNGFVPASTTTNISIPTDGEYLVMLSNAGLTIYKPKNIIINGIDIFKSLQLINEENLPAINWAKSIQPYISKSANLFDKNVSDITYNAYIQGANINNDTSYNISGYIQIFDYQQYTHKVYPSYFGSTANRVSCFDEDKNYLGFAQGVITNGINVFTPLAGTAFVRVNIATGDMDSYMFVEGTTYPNNFIPFGIYTNNLDVNRLSPLWGKKLCCDGDSIMHGAAQGGVSNGGFVKPIADRFGMVLQNIAVPGGTIRSNTYWDADQQNPRHWICDSLATLDADGDYYIFEGGVNDVGSSAVMGTISWGYTANLDTTTFCGAMEKCCKTLVENYMGKKYGFVFVHRIWQPADTLANSFFDNQKEILKKWGIPFIDLMELAPSLNLINDLKSTYTNNADGWHPNILGYATYYVPKIIAWLETL